MSKRDYYEVLGVGREASTHEIKSAYRKLAVQYHPDRNPGDTEAEDRFKEAAEAYAVLSDGEKRARYDRFGHQAQAGGFGGFDPTIFGDFSDILGDLFGFGGARRRGRRGVPGADLRYDLELPFRDAVFGTEERLEIPRLETCDSCEGSGAADGNLSTCGTCGGHGQVRFSQGFFTVSRTCPQCGGMGRVVSDPCEACSGEGRIPKERVLTVQIPPGVDDGMRLRLRGEGEHGRLGGPTGDLEVVLHVQPHERWQREGADVLETIEITYPQMVLGTSVEVETLHGEEKLKIPGGTQPGKRFRLARQGIPILGRDGRGDHWVEVRLAVPDPKRLDEQEVALLRKLAEIEGSEVHEGRGVLEKVKNLFA